MLSNDQRLEALSWKGDELDISYGKLVSRSNSEEIEQFYREYEKRLIKRQMELKEREAARKGAPPPHRKRM